MKDPLYIESSSPPRLSVAWVIYDSLEVVSGGTIYDKLIVEGLRARGHAVAIVALERTDRPSDVREKANDAIARLKKVGDAPPIFVCDELCFPHLPHLPKGVRRVLLVHHLSLWEREAQLPLTCLREIACVRASETCITTGRTTRTRLRDEFRIDAAFVPPGADRLLRHQPIDERGATSPGIASATKNAMPPHLLFVGSVTPRKRVLELMETLARAGNPVHLTLVGSLERDDAYVSKVKARAKQLATEASRLSLTFAGEVADKTLARHYETHDALIVASSLEGYGMVVDEALSFGLPVLIERDAVATETLVEGVNARVFSFADPSLLFAYLANRDERRALTISCRETRANLPTWSGSVGSFERVLYAF